MTEPPEAAPSPSVHEAQKDSNDLVLSYTALRQFLGYLGAVLPLSLIAYAIGTPRGFERSISDFYYTPMGDLLVGILCAIGVFLLCYKGFKPLRGEWITDRRTGTVAGLAAVGVALFPVRRDGLPPCDWIADGCVLYGSPIHPAYLHYGSAFVFFACLAVFCLVLFTRGDRTPDGQILWTPRNRFYIGCGAVIVAAILAMAPYVLIPALKPGLDTVNYLFWCETAAVLAFAASWLHKGKAGESLAQAGATVVRLVKGA